MLKNMFLTPLFLSYLAKEAEILPNFAGDNKRKDEI